MSHAEHSKKDSPLLLRLLILILFLLSAQPITSYASAPEINWTDLLPPAAAQDQIQTEHETAANAIWDQKNVRIHGFIVPLERTEDMQLLSFLLVPYYGACIHVPPPPPNQCIYVTLAKPLPDAKAMDQITVEGVLKVQANNPLASSTYSLEEAAKTDEESDNPLTNVLPLFLTFISALSVSIGWLLPIQRLRLQPAVLAAITGLASGMMLALGCSPLLRFSLSALVLFLIGFSLFLLLAHTGHHEEECDSTDKSVFRAVMAIGVHNIPESFFVLSMAFGDTTLGALLALTMMSHNFPLGLSVSLLQTGIQPLKRLQYILVSSFCPAVLACIIFFGLRNIVSLETMQSCYPFAGGCLTAIAMRELLPKSCMVSNKIAISSFFVGVIFLATMLRCFFKG